MENLRHRQARRPAQDLVLPARPAAAEELPPAPSVQVIYGANVQALPQIAGLRVSEVRTLMQQIMGVDPRALTLVNGQPVRLSDRIAPGDVVEFVHRAGEKGVRHELPH